LFFRGGGRGGGKKDRSHSPDGGGPLLVKVLVLKTANFEPKGEKKEHRSMRKGKKCAHHP